MANTQSEKKPPVHRIDRKANAQKVLGVLRKFGPSTQAQIARATLLSRATVNNIVQALRDQGTVEYQWKNGREALVTLGSTRGSVISIKVQERCVTGYLFDFSGHQRLEIHSGELPNYQNKPSTPALVLELSKRLIELGRTRESPVLGVAIAIEGPIETSTGAIAPWAWQRLPHWKNVNLHQYFSKNVRLPLVVENDANFAALAEWSWGEGRGADDFLHITCSEGIGGGIILNGQIYRGGTGLAGEIGHMVIEEAGELCFCGSRGCLSSFATERAIVASLRNSEKPKLSLVEIVDSAHHGDAACQRVLFEAGLHLGKALTTVVRVIGPSVIAIGGTLATGGEVVLEGLRSSAEIINLRAIAKSPRFCLATIIKDAAELGGVSAILSELDLGASSLADWMRESRSLPSAESA
jgi:predicted NBD/HSP70 family sugar kinase/biotin operon repressor